MKRSQSFKILFTVTLLVALLFNLGQGSISSAQEAVESTNYAPGLFYQYSEYEGRGNEYAPFSMTLDYTPDENGVYQVSRETAGTTISYVYQLTTEGIYELAYFPESYDQVDWRYHDDASDEKKSLFFPTRLAVGDTFSRGYRAEQGFTVVDYRTEFVIEDITYYNVIVIETNLDDGGIQRFYYAPQVGEIFSEFSVDDANSVVTQLDFLRGPTYIQWVP